MKTVYFHGDLKKLCPEPIQVVATTLNEVLAALKIHPALDPKLTTTRYEAKIRGLESFSMLNHEWVGDEVHIECIGTVSRLVGSGGALRNPWVRFVIAVIIIVIAYFTGQYQLAAGAMSYSAPVMMAMSFGIAMAAGALTEILAPSPDENDKRSHLANSFPNTVAAGTVIPIVIGEHLWGGHYISFNTSPINYTQGGGGGGAGGGGGGGTISKKQA